MVKRQKILEQYSRTREMIKDQGAQNWACVASFIETCKLNGVNPHDWLTDVLTKLVNRWPAKPVARAD
jgi:hypothetical protein